MRRTKIVAAMLSLVFVFMLFPSLRVSADASGTCGYNLTYTLDDDGNLTISGTGTSIVAASFSNNTSIKTVTMSASVVELYGFVFEGCTSLETISMPNVTSIGGYAFEGCTSLTTISMPKADSIGNCAFINCTSLETISMPSVTSINSGAFEGCTSLETISMPSVTSIDSYAFEGCTSLETISMPSVTSIYSWAFNGCTSLTSINIPDSVTSLGANAFYNCTNLSSVTMSWNEYNKLGTNAINLCFGNSPITIYFCKETLTATNGTISVDSRDYSNGTITLKLEPDTNYALDSVSVKYSDGTEEDVIPTNGKYIVDVTKGDIEVNATFIPTYEIQFVNTDGTVLQSSSVPYGETPVCTITPTQAATAQYTYTFAGWDPAITTVTADATYTATYDSTLNEYTITFVNDDKTVLQSSSVPYGDTPVCTITPTKAADAQYSYTFKGWNDGTKTYGPTEALPAVTDDASYTAVFESSINEYTVTFTDADGNQLQSGKLPYGTIPAYNGTPTKAETDKYTYSFAGWKSGNSTYGVSSTLPQVTGDVTYTAVFTETAKSTPTPTAEPTAATTPATTPAVTTPAPGTYYVQSIEEKDGAIIITIKRTENDDQTYELVQSIETDGKQLTVGDQIELTSGSAIITIKKDFVSTLTPGTHSMKVTFKDGGSITLEYTVKEPEKAQAAVQATGEETAITAMIGTVLILTACGVTLFAIRKRREDQ